MHRHAFRALSPDEPTPASMPVVPLDPKAVEAFVGAAHGDLGRVEEMLSCEPRLLNAAWDWGGGDFETAVGAAGHMGRRDIASLLIERGARYDVFVAAMLGHADVVRGTLAACPSLLRAKGPHGIPLLAHARAGGEEAAEVVQLLESLGLV